MPDNTELIGRLREQEETFTDAVWEALKGDHNDLRKQAIILRAHRAPRSHIEREVIELREALERSERVRITACEFIDSHVADPDITAEMAENYDRFRRAREAFHEPMRERIRNLLPSRPDEGGGDA